MKVNDTHHTYPTSTSLAINLDFFDNLEKHPKTFPKASPKGFWDAGHFFVSSRTPPKVRSVRRGPIRCLASRARPSYTRDAPGAPDTTKCEARSGGPDASAAHDKFVPLSRQITPLPGSITRPGVEATAAATSVAWYASVYDNL
jgi:hypothetical protein